jgi:hypothetical protein
MSATYPFRLNLVSVKWGEVHNAIIPTGINDDPIITNSNFIRYLPNGVKIISNKGKIIVANIIPSTRIMMNNNAFNNL